MERDRRTQVRWGLADFRRRFGREPESIWLPETACNDEVLGLLIDEGLKFVVLAPGRAKRIRKLIDIPSCKQKFGKLVVQTADWQNAGEIDTSVAYRYFH